jgi:hypothetical protein
MMPARDAKHAGVDDKGSGEAECPHAGAAAALQREAAEHHVGDEQRELGGQPMVGEHCGREHGHQHQRRAQ